MGWFDKKTKELKKINSGDKITINCPDGYIKTDTGERNHPVSVNVKNNCTITKKLWIQFNINIYRVDQLVNFILDYNSKELSNFLLLNIAKKTELVPVKEKTKKELEAELKTAVDNNNFEIAAAINEKLKNS